MLIDPRARLTRYWRIKVIENQKPLWNRYELGRDDGHPTAIIAWQDDLVFYHRIGNDYADGIIDPPDNAHHLSNTLGDIDAIRLRARQLWGQYKYLTLLYGEAETCKPL